MPMEHDGTAGTEPNLLTHDNKFVCVINIIIFIGNYHQKTGHKKRAIKNPAEAGDLPNPCGLDFDFGYLLGLD
jgi:hypothetical protein